MKLKELILILENYAVDNIDYDVRIVISANTSPTTPTTGIEAIHAGFDFDNGKLLIYPQEDLCKISEAVK
jgi:hypothetical protein